MCVVQAIDFNGNRVLVGLRCAATGNIPFTDLTDNLVSFTEDCVKRGVIVNAAVVETGDETWLSQARGPRGEHRPLHALPGIGVLADL